MAGMLMYADTLMKATDESQLISAIAWGVIALVFGGFILYDKIHPTEAN